LRVVSFRKMLWDSRKQIFDIPRGWMYGERLYRGGKEGGEVIPREKVGGIVF